MWWVQASSQNVSAWAVVPIRARSKLGTTRTTLNCFADVCSVQFPLSGFLHRNAHGKFKSYVPPPGKVLPKILHSSLVTSLPVHHHQSRFELMTTMDGVTPPQTHRDRSGHLTTTFAYFSGYIWPTCPAQSHLSFIVLLPTSANIRILISIMCSADTTPDRLRFT